jgi:pimeloyl-ACP methyl ester carboxylesterase
VDCESPLRNSAVPPGTHVMRPLVLIHGGGMDSRCWDLLLPHLDGPAIAVDLPGRRARPALSASFSECAQAVRGDVDAHGFDDVILVGHSQAGCSMPATCAALGDRVRHAVFIACTVPEHGSSTLDTLDPELQALMRSAAGMARLKMDAATAQIVFGPDLTAKQSAWCAERLVEEIAEYITQPVDLSPLTDRTFPRTWVRTLLDVVVAADKQLRFVKNVGGDCSVIDIDTGHMPMVNKPREVAQILNEIASF